MKEMDTRYDEINNERSEQNEIMNRVNQAYDKMAQDVKNIINQTDQEDSNSAT
jgi:hypothetical protein